MTSKYLTIPAVMAGALGVSGAVVARAAEPTTAELMAQIQQLQGKVQQMQTQQEQQAQKLEAKDVDSTVDSVLKDAEKRSKLMQMEGFTAGWTDGNFMLKSTDGSFLLIPELQLQARYILNYRQDQLTPNSDSDTELGFEIARAKLNFSGNAFTKDLTYNIRFVTGTAYDSASFSDSLPSSTSGGLFLDNAYVQYQFSDNMAVKLGQWKDNVYHEQNVEDVLDLAVDKSLVNQQIGGGITGYVQGIALVWDDHKSPMRGEISFHDGIDTQNTNFVNVGGGATDPDIDQGKTNFGISGRFEYALMGTYKGYGDMTAYHGAADKKADDLLILGAGFDVTQAGDTTPLFFTADAEWKPANLEKLAVYGAFLGVYTNNAATATGSQDFFDWGFLVQAGWMLTDKWEVFGRYDYTGFDQDRNLNNDSISEISVGVNYYWFGQGAKFTIDANWLPNGCPASFPALGYLPSDDDQFVVRAQFTLAI